MKIFCKQAAGRNQIKKLLPQAKAFLFGAYILLNLNNQEFQIRCVLNIP
jgi:hypothetical protein